VRRAVLDANVLLSAAIHPSGSPGRLVERFLRDGAFELILSSAIIAEVQRAFTYPRILKALHAGFASELWLEDLVVLADLIGDSPIRRVCRDPDDDKYLAAALAGRATHVVTGDRDLLDLREYEGILLVPPDEFLRHLDR
jgi:putative PIN family toxin of toxin-antitoxin system